jgi:hypothetical protein
MELADDERNAERPILNGERKSDDVEEQRDNLV